MEEKTSEYIKARDRAVKYILYKMRTSSEVYNKLLELEFDERIITSVIYDLTELGYINDEEYIKKFVESSKKAKKISKSMIKLKLKNKGIDKETIEKYLEEADFDDIDAIKKVLVKKHFSTDLSFDEQNKIKAYCLRKGFGMSEILKAMKEENI